MNETDNPESALDASVTAGLTLERYPTPYNRYRAKEALEQLEHQLGLHAQATGENWRDIVKRQISRGRR